MHLEDLKLELLQSLKMVRDIRENGSPELRSERVTEFRFGLMDQSMKGGGKKTKQMEREGSFTLTGTFMKVNGRTIKLTGKVFTLIWMEQGMKVHG
jgi:hypothetical protein